MPAHQTCPISDDSALLKLEEQFFEQRELATALDDEIIRLGAIWSEKSERLYRASLDGDTPPRYVYSGPLAHVGGGGLLMHRPQSLKKARRRDQNRPPGGAYS
jgi:hypothetical protein